MMKYIENLHLSPIKNRGLCTPERPTNNPVYYKEH